MTNTQQKRKKAVAKDKAAIKKTIIKKPAKKTGDMPADTSAKSIAALLKKGRKEKMPAVFPPMLATLVDKPFDDPDWEYEVKWDGYRAIAFIDRSFTDLRSRNNKSFAEKFYPVFEAVKSWKINAIVDGEIVVVKENGISSFSDLQNWRSEADGQLLYYVFDVLWLNGLNLTELPLKERKQILQTLIPESDIIRSGYTVTAKGSEFYDAALEMNLEGIIAKRSDSKYYPGERSKDWLKIKVQKRQEVVIGGYTRNEGTSKLFSSLLLGVFDKGKFHYVGKVGTGFNDKLQKELMARFKKLTLKKCPFNEIPDYNKPSRFRPNPPHAVATWLKPELVCEISFAERTQDGVFRHPSFESMRIDKNASDVVMETALPVAPAVKSLPNKKASHTTIVKPTKASSRKTLLNPTEKTQVKKINGNEVKFTNLDKVFWPKEKITKGDMINYYYQVAPFILPYIKNRPQSLNRFPNGINGKSFYQKDVTGKVPDWVETFPYFSNDENQDRNFFVATDEASLLYMANLGAIEMNPWFSTVQKPENPDWCVLDLDPDKGNTFDQVIETALMVKAVLDDLGITGYCKTSGSTGLHIYIPLAAKYSYDQSQMFGKWIATEVHERLPKFTSIERLTRNRKGKLYIDYLQNRPQATLAAPYSLRPKPGATVSMPLYWEEVKPGLKMTDFTIFNAMERIKSEGDIFKPVMGKGINLKKILASLEQL